MSSPLGLTNYYTSYIENNLFKNIYKHTIYLPYIDDTFSLF